MNFLVPYNCQIIKSLISHFVVLSWSPHLPIQLNESWLKTAQGYY